MLERIPVDSSPQQEMTIQYEATQLLLNVRYNTVGDHWELDVYDQTQDRQICQGLALAVGVPMLWRAAVPYVFWLVDSSGVGLDPTGGEDLGSRCLLYIGDKADVETAMGL